MGRILRLFSISFCLLNVLSCASGQDVKTYGFRVEESFPHDVSSYTQGLFFCDGGLYESAGQYGESNFRKVDLASGRVLQRENFEGRYFAEGACVLD